MSFLDQFRNETEEPSTDNKRIVCDFVPVVPTDDLPANRAWYFSRNFISGSKKKKAKKHKPTFKHNSISGNNKLFSTLEYFENPDQFILEVNGTKDYYLDSNNIPVSCYIGNTCPEEYFRLCFLADDSSRREVKRFVDLPIQQIKAWHSHYGACHIWRSYPGRSRFNISYEGKKKCLLIGTINGETEELTPEFIERFSNWRTGGGMQYYTVCWFDILQSYDNMVLQIGKNKSKALPFKRHAFNIIKSCELDIGQENGTIIRGETLTDNPIKLHWIGVSNSEIEVVHPLHYEFSLTIENKSLIKDRIRSDWVILRHLDGPVNRKTFRLSINNKRPTDHLILPLAGLKLTHSAGKYRCYGRYLGKQKTKDIIPSFEGFAEERLHFEWIDDDSGDFVVSLYEKIDVSVAEQLAWLSLKQLKSDRKIELVKTRIKIV